LTITWGIFETKEETFDLSHLDEMVISVEIGGKQHAILVEFSDHCFTGDESICVTGSIKLAESGDHLHDVR
jgi:hypothetical protein